MKNTYAFVSLIMLTLVPSLGAQTSQAGSANGRPSAALEQATPLGLKWNETYRLFDVPVQNNSAAVLKILGAQTSPTLFVVSFPDSVAAGQQASISLLYEAREGAGGNNDFVRLLTDQGVKTIVVPHQRQQVVRFDAKKLAWNVGDAPSAKSVTVTVSGGLTMPKAARAAGSGNSTLITPLGGGQFRISVTPASTAKPESFPVFIDFDPTLPGLNAVLTCSVNS